jgi:putative component of membrane protein insertase Oxa1/YidC/SpoIIIJ protein YidD
MKSLWTFGFILIVINLKGQNVQSDLALFRAQQNSSLALAKEKKTFSLVSSLSSSPQWGHSCYFEIPCSDFHNQLVHRYGIVKGLFLTIDRYGKCNKISFFETLPNRINAEGKIIDSVNFYRSR